MGVRLSDDEAWQFLADGHTAVFTTLRRDGWPVSLPVWFVVEDRRVYVATPMKSKKVAWLRHNGRGCLLVEQGVAWTDLAAAELPVRASVLDDGDEAVAVSAHFARKYAAFRPVVVSVPDATKRHYAGQAVIRLEPRGPLLSWDNSRIRLTAP
jgi:nitroimidazol reductase NimA-like FMN-containing flavoprotein (pyridoxamine 5'-phosphate oxidase superfamily)